MKDVLSVDRLEVTYDSTRVLRDVGFVLDEGTCAVVKGDNGSGKSSLIEAIGGIHLLQGGTVQGNVSLAQIDLTRLMPHERLDMGLITVPDNGGLFPGLTVRENIELGFADPTHGPDPEIACRYFPVLAERLGARVGQLSGGERQLVSLSRLLYVSGDMHAVLLDEPFRELDDRYRRTGERLVTALAAYRRVAVLVTSHKKDLSPSLFDKVFTLRNGTLNRESR